MPEEKDELTQEGLEAGTAVAQAGVQAAQAEPEPAKRRTAARRAMKKEATERNLKLSEEDIDRLSDMFSDKVIDQLDARGVFEAPPEPVSAPPAAPETVREPPPEEPQRSGSFAERFRSK